MGYIYISLSAFFFCLMTVFVKIAGQELGTIQIVFTRGIITLLFTLVIIKSKKVYLGRLINGKPDGLWIKWSKNGNKIEEGNYSNGLLEGYFALYHPNGLKSLEGSILHGKKNGLFAMYHENGVRSFRGEYFDGVGKGKWIYYNEDGAKIRIKDCDLEECK